MEEKLKPFIEEYSDDFYESIEDIRQYLNNNNKKSQKLNYPKNRYHTTNSCHYIHNMTSGSFRKVK